MGDNKKIDLLWLTPSAFHNNVAHAGGNSINFYFAQFYADSNFKTSILCLNDFDDDLQKMQSQYLESTLIYNVDKKNVFRRAKDYFSINYLYSFFKTFIPLYYITNGYYKRRLIKLLNIAKSRLTPDVIVVEYTSVLLFADLIRAAFPNARLVGSCHDIVFQSIERKLDISNNSVFKKWYIKEFKKLESDALNIFDLITVPSIKDKVLVEKAFGIAPHNIEVITLYYQTYHLDDHAAKDGVVFYGYLAREENYLSVIWFLENIWHKILTTNPELKLYIVGGGASEQFKKMVSGYKNIVLTGYVNDPAIYFSRCFGMIVPLQLGAGVKVKSLEAMSSGVPLITNMIGIEGIDAKAERDFLLCHDADDWTNAVTRICSEPALRQLLINNAKELIQNKYSPTRSVAELKKRLQVL